MLLGLGFGRVETCARNLCVEPLANRLSGLGVSQKSGLGTGLFWEIGIRLKATLDGALRKFLWDNSVVCLSAPRSHPSGTTLPKATLRVNVGKKESLPDGRDLGPGG